MVFVPTPDRRLLILLTVFIFSVFLEISDEEGTCPYFQINSVKKEAIAETRKGCEI
jgi:hypothetical protein